MRLLLPLLIVPLALACGGSSGGDAGVDAPGETDVLVTFDAVEASDGEGDAPPVQLCKPRFHAEIPSTGPVRAPIVAADGRLVVASGDLVMSLSSEGLECTECWRHTVLPEGATGVVLGNPALLADAIVVGTSQGLLVKLSLQDGEERWRFPDLKEKVVTAPVRVGDTLLVAGAGALFYLVEGSPLEVFVNGVEALDESPQQPVVHDAMALIATGGQVLRRAADGTGDALVVFEEGQGELTSAPAPLGDGRFVLGADWKADGTTHRGLAVLDPASGATSRVETEGLLDGPSMLLVSGPGKVLGVTPSGEGLVADLGTGTSTRFALGGTAVGYPLLGNDGVWYLSVAQGEAGVKLYAREATGVDGGQVLWTDTVDGSQPAPVGVTPGGTVLFAAGLKLHGYRCGTSNLAAAPWPKFQNDGANSGVF